MKHVVVLVVTVDGGIFKLVMHIEEDGGVARVVPDRRI